MVRLIVGIVLADVVLYFWGFLFWGVNPFWSQVIRQASDDRAAAQAVRTHFPARGTYLVPGLHQPAETLATAFPEGPVAFVHVTHPDGRPIMDPQIMLNGFLLNTVVVVLIALVLNQVKPALPSYASRVGHCLLIGLTAAILVDIGEAAWWTLPLDWKLWQAGYSASVWLVAGAVLAAFIRPAVSQPAAV